MSQSVPVLIIGAGPTGLNLANLLAQYGIAHRLIDQRVEPIQTSNALVVQARSLEMWDSMGIAEEAIARGKKLLGLSLSSLNKSIGKIEFANAGLATQFPFLLGLPQADSEHLLTLHLTKKGGKIERGVTLVDFTKTDELVTVKLQHANGESETITCDWLVAADGSHSVVRKKLNLDFKGQQIPEKFIMMDAEISADLNPDYAHAILSPLGPLAFLPMRDFVRVICSVTHDQGIKDFNNPTVSDFEYVIQQRSRFPCRLNKAIWISSFLTHHRLIDNYCHGRVLFAGDSSHIHSPVGGQGMNTGMQDTFNLAWKLALVIKGQGDAKLLDTYNTERRAVAKKVLSNTTKMTKIVTLKNRLLISLRNYFLHAMLTHPSLQHAIANNISELAISYSPNSIIRNHGERAPDAILHDLQHQPLQLRKLFVGLKHKVLLFSGKKYSVECANNIIQVARWVHDITDKFLEPIIISSSANYFNDETIYIDESGAAHHAYSLERGGMCLVRPDQYIGFCHARIGHDILSEHLFSHYFAR